MKITVRNSKFGFWKVEAPEGDPVADEFAQVKAVINERFENEPKFEEILPLMKQAIEDKKAKDEARAIQQEEQRIASQEHAKAEAKRRAEAEAKRLAEIEAAATFDWNDQGKAIANLDEKIYAVAGFSIDSRKKNWIKQVDSVDANAQNGYAFQGDLIKSGTVEVTKTDCVYLVAVSAGSNKHPYMAYTVVTLTDGKLNKTNISDDDSKPGWALRIRDSVAQLVNVKTATKTITVSADLFVKLANAANGDIESYLQKLISQ